MACEAVKYNVHVAQIYYVATGIVSDSFSESSKTMHARQNTEIKPLFWQNSLSGSLQTAAVVDGETVISFLQSLRNPSRQARLHG